ncbi:MAG TPA: hypothetical protein PLP17_11760, partial [Oligoflexia bacterium]|nr:hypothetical protein [Oligoflexia bacterium]
MLLAYIIVSLLVGGAIGAFFVEQGRASKGNRFHWVKRVQDGVTYRRCDRSGNPFTGFVLILAGLASFLLARFALSLMLGPYYRGLVIPAGFGFFALCALGSALVFLPAGINQFFLLESWAIVQRMVKGGRKDLRGVFEW